VPGHAGPWPRATRRRAPAGLEFESESGAGRETAPTSGAHRSAGEREEGAGAQADWAGGEEAGRAEENGPVQWLAGCARERKERRGGKEKRKRGHGPGCQGEKERRRRERREGGRLGWAQRREERGKREKSKTNAFEFGNEI
jgi:hypothetical protein